MLCAGAKLLQSASRLNTPLQKRHNGAPLHVSQRKVGASALGRVSKFGIHGSAYLEAKAVGRPAKKANPVSSTRSASTASVVRKPRSSMEAEDPIEMSETVSSAEDPMLIEGDEIDATLGRPKALPLDTQMTLVRIGRVMPMGFFTARDRNLAIGDTQELPSKTPVPPPLSEHDKRTLQKKAALKKKDVPLEIDPEFQRLVPPSYMNQLMPLSGQYQASEPGLVELEGLKALYGDQLLDQLDLETQAANLEILRYQAAKDDVTTLGRGSEMGPARTLVRKWYAPLVNALKQKIAHEMTRTSKLAQVLSSVRAETLAAITLHSTIGQTLSRPEGTAFQSLALAIAETTQAQINYQRIKEFNPDFLERKYGPKAVFSLPIITRLSRSMLQTPTENEDNVEQILKEEGEAIASAFQHSTMELNEDTSINRLAAADQGDNLLSSSSSSSSSPKSSKRKMHSNSSVYSSQSSSSSPQTSSATSSSSPTSSTSYPSNSGQRRWKTPAEQGAPFAALWTKSLKMDVGKFLLSTMVEVSTFTHVTEHGVKHEKPAFEVEIPKSTAAGVSTIKRIKLVDAIMENVSYEHVLQEANHMRHYPMLVPPRPWRGPEDGGYFLYPASILRYYNFEHQVKPLYENHDQLTLMYEALTTLGETPWRINKDVYNVIKQAWSEGGAVADIPSRQDLPLPVPGVEGKTPQWYKQLKRIQTENYNKNSLRCDLLLKLQVAEKFSEDVMYFPHNMDFRGRVYPIPPHLNHMGSDLCRGLLTFAEAQPLGPRGLYWLKIQLANLYGQDKIPFDQRVAWAEEHLPEVEDSAARPLRGRRWWLKAEDPWQCLACCFELSKAMKHPEGPEAYSSSLPIHQDGTCNGLQHYAALGGDEQGAKSVNLLPADRPQDVYADVASLVQARIAQDAANGVEIAILLKGQVNRRIIKQTVMTSVYGVTFVGARQQIANALKDRGVLNEDSRYQASVYLARATFDSIGEMFTGARSIMDWFATCASLVAKRNRLVSWTTPLGLPVSQPYKKLNKKNVLKTAFQTITLESESAGPVNSLRQRSAFPPNFVHSLDSSHMLLTALACKRKGIMFSSVHDSYWSHACNVDRMNVELRDAFVELHRRPLLQRLYDQFAKDNPDIVFPPVPERGSFDLELVKQSPYFFN